jgi:hypothetical protein
MLPTDVCQKIHVHSDWDVAQNRQTCREKMWPRMLPRHLKQVLLTTRDVTRLPRTPSPTSGCRYWQEDVAATRGCRPRLDGCSRGREDASDYTRTWPATRRRGPRRRMLPEKRGQNLEIRVDAEADWRWDEVKLVRIRIRGCRPQLWRPNLPKHTGFATVPLVMRWGACEAEWGTATGFSLYPCTACGYVYQPITHCEWAPR